MSLGKRDNPSLILPRPTLTDRMLDLRGITLPYNCDDSYLVGAAKTILASIRKNELAGDSAETAIDEWLEAYRVSKEEPNQ